MSDEQSGDTDRGGEVQQAYCDRCGTIGDNLLCIKPNQESGLENWKPLCDDCLEELGEWFQSMTDDHPLEAADEMVEIPRKEVAILLHDLFDVRQRESLSAVSCKQMDKSIQRLEKSLEAEEVAGDE